MIVNENNIPILGSQIDFVLFQNIFFGHKNIFFPNENVYIICIVANGFDENIDLYTILPEKIYEAVIKKEIKLVIVNYVEAHIYVIKKIYDYFILKHNINENSIYFITEGYGLEKNVSEVAKEKNKLEIKTFFLSISELIVSKSIFSLGIQKTYNKKTINKKFIMFNRRWRQHRPLFVSLLKLNNLLDEGYISLVENKNHGETETWDYFYSNFVNQNILDKFLYDQLIKNKNEITLLKNLTVDTNNVFSTNQVAPLRLSSLQFYMSTYFSIVPETYFFNDNFAGLFITEKIFKPMAFMHPFILLARPHSLKLLQIKGYKTFSPYINEDYDNESDDMTRMYMVLDEVKRLCSFSENERDKFIDETKKICIYNFDLLKSKYTDFSSSHILPLN